MSAAPLRPAFEAAELHWDLPSANRVLCYHRAGSGRPVLLLHSINAAPSAFEVSPFFTDQELDFGRPLYAPDLPGFGRSDRLDRVYTPEFFAQCIVEMLDAIGASSVDVIALSTSAEFAARAALSAQERISSLTLVSPTGLSRRRTERSAAGPRVHKFLRLPFIGEGLFRALRSKSSIRYFLNMGFYDSAPEEMVEYAYLTARLPGASYAPFYFLSGQLFCPDAVGELYIPLECPVLVLYDEDANISFDFLDMAIDQGRDWHAQRIVNTRGLPHFDQAAATRNALDAFWSA